MFKKLRFIDSVRLTLRNVKAFQLCIISIFFVTTITIVVQQVYLINPKPNEKTKIDPRLRISRQRVEVAYEELTRGNNASKTWCLFPNLTPFHSSMLYTLEEPEKIVCRDQSRWPLLFSSPPTVDPILKKMDNPENFGYKNCCYHTESVARQQLTLNPNNSQQVDKMDAIHCKALTENETHIPKNLEFVSVLCEPKSSPTFSLLTAALPWTEKEPKLKVVDMFILTPPKLPKMSVTKKSKNSHQLKGLV